MKRWHLCLVNASLILGLTVWAALSGAVVAALLGVPWVLLCVFAAGYSAAAWPQERASLRKRGRADSR